MDQYQNDQDEKAPLGAKEVIPVVNNTSPRRRYPCIAATLGFLVPGLGHIYAGKPQRGALWYLAALLFPFMLSPAGLQFSFRGFVLFLALEITVAGVVIVDSALVARRQGAIRLEPWQRWWVYGLIIIFATSFSIITQVTAERKALGIRAFQIPSESMAPGLLVGDHIMVDLEAYTQKTPARGDIVVFRHPEHPDVFYIKRVAAVGGNTVALKGDKLYVDGMAVEEPYLRTDGIAVGQKEKAFGPISVGRGKLFMLGDNRDYSYDSRQWGTVDTGMVIGKAIYIYWSWDAWTGAPRMGRMGTAIQGYQY